MAVVDEAEEDTHELQLLELLTATNTIKHTHTYYTVSSFSPTHHSLFLLLGLRLLVRSLINLCLELDVLQDDGELAAEHGHAQAVI